MPIGDDYSAEIELLSGLRALTSAYEEISIMRIGRIRDKVIATRAFREGLFGVFSEVRASRHLEIEKILLKRRPLVGSTAPKKEKAAVLLSSNQRLSGTISAEVASRFSKHIKTHQGDVAIVGTVARNYFATAQPDLKFTYFDLPHDSAPLTDHTRLIAYLRQYKEVSIFYGKFVNVVDQVAATTRLAQDRGLSSTIKRQGSNKEKTATDYLFEPKLQQVLDFFDTQLFAMLFRQTVNESSLAHLGSRITAMEAASGTIDDRYVRLLQDQRRSRRRQKNKEQRQMLAGMALWGL